MPVTPRLPLSRRALLQGVAVAAPFIAVGYWPSRALAQESGTPVAAPQQFSFDTLTEEMRTLASTPHVTAPPPEGFLGDLTYDTYRLIRFRDSAARWQDGPADWRLHAFHMGWLFPEPVRLFDVTTTDAGEQATEILFSTDDFEYLNDLAAQVPEHAELPGVAGFKVNYPLNRPDKWDEVAAFLGASYFRALGRNSAYGLSARGLALNTGTADPEEFPRFSRFYLSRDPAGGADITIYATLEGPSVTGAYRIVMRPGIATEMDVTARLFFRQAVTELGIAPLTSMFLFSEKNRAEFDDYRPNVHDSDGLRIVRADGDVIWRPLNNPSQLATSYFSETAPRAFGLHQRDRDFASYQDIGAHYHRRPSADVIPLGDWGQGAVRLVEIPSDLEANDNIVAYWVPAQPVAPGDAREFAYRLRWGDLPLDPMDPLSYVFETRSGAGGFAGVAAEPNTRKFVVDFKGGDLGQLPEDAAIEPVASVANAELLGVTLQKIPGTDIWRGVIDLRAEPGAVVEIGLHVAGYGQRLTENWLYQWINA
jgi:glucans biosynthesis protein